MKKNIKNIMMGTLLAVTLFGQAFSIPLPDLLASVVGSCKNTTQDYASHVSISCCMVSIFETFDSSLTRNEAFCCAYKFISMGFVENFVARAANKCSLKLGFGDTTGPTLTQDEKKYFTDVQSLFATLSNIGEVECTWLSCASNYLIRGSY